MGVWTTEQRAAVLTRESQSGLRRWERSVAGALRPLRLRSIRSRIVAFTLAATLIPTLTTTWISYQHNRRTLSAKLEAELRAASAMAARDLEDWLADLSASAQGVPSLDERTGASLGAELALLAQGLPASAALVVLGVAGDVIARTTTDLENPTPRAPARAARAPIGEPGRLMEYRTAEGGPVLGVSARLPRFGWSIVAEIPRSVAYAELGRLWKLTAVSSVVLLAVVGLLASAFGIVIVGPLNRLRQAAARVAKGDLDVRVPTSVNGEIGYLTEVFNLMVERLRDHRRELERLSTTDALTGVHNRHRLLDVLHQEARRSTRHGRPFSVLMIDVDDFKVYNDTYGHVEGDEALRRVAGVLRVTMRTVDFIARYGGDEFLVLMPETELEMAEAAAERLRARLRQERVAPGAPDLTLSIGVAEHTPALRRPDEVIAAADQALYRAKESGRDRTVAADRADVSSGRLELLGSRRAPPRFALDRAEVM